MEHAVWSLISNVHIFIVDYNWTLSSSCNGSVFLANEKLQFIDFVAKELILSQTTNFRGFQTERVCICQFRIWWKWQKVLQTGRKHWKKKKLLGTSNFSFFHSVFKRLVLHKSNKGLFWKWFKSASPVSCFCANCRYWCTIQLTNIWTELIQKHLQVINLMLHNCWFLSLIE